MRCKPELSATIVDTNQATINLTGNNTKLVKHESIAKISITTSAKNSASISSKKVNNTIVSENNITIEKIETDTIIVTVTDSRGYTNSVTLKPEMINYIPLTINATIKRTQPTTGEVDISFSGNYFNGTFGEINNTLDINWYYREKGSNEWITGGTISKIIKENTYNNENTSISLGKIFNYQKAYEFYLKVNDKITTLEPSYNITQGIPIFNWGKDFINIFGNLKINETNILEIIFPIGSTYITQTNINPNSILGFGTWERIKGKVCIGLDEDDNDFKTIKKVGGNKTTTLTQSNLPTLAVPQQFNTEGNGWTLGNGGTPQLYSQGNQYIGQGQAFNNLPPYEVVGFMWIRRS